MTVRDLFLDGNRANLTELDEGQQTHLIRLGGSVAISGGANNVKILNCTLTRADGDGVAILPISGRFGAGEEVSNVRIAFCEFIDNNRSGISNQRSTELVEILHNYFEGTSDQDIHFEPTGGELATGPRRYVIFGNTIVHSTKPASITLSGVSPDIPSSNNILAYNQIYGGGLGMVDAEHTSIVGNYIEGGLLAPDPVVRFREKVSGVRFTNNHVVRPAGALPGSLLLVASATSNPSFASSGELIDPVIDTFTRKNHGLETGAGPVRVTTSGTLPAGLALETDYWVIRVDANVVKLAAPLADALAEIPVDITDVGEGLQQMTLIHFPRGVDVHDNRPAGARAVRHRGHPDSRTPSHWPRGGVSATHSLREPAGSAGTEGVASANRSTTITSSAPREWTLRECASTKIWLLPVASTRVAPDAGSRGSTVASSTAKELVASVRAG